LKYDSSTTGFISYSGTFNVGGSTFDRLSAGSQVGENISLGGALSTIKDWVNGDDGNDTINSGGGNDYVMGGAGNDSISGISGDDTIEGGTGADTLNGGAGTADFLSYASSSAAVNINLLTPSATGGDATGDVISLFENILGSAFDDTLIGDGSANTIFGGAGNDTIDGGGASDILNGDAGDDSILGGLGADTLFGGIGNDTLDGGIGNDSILGGDGNDFITGQDGTDTLTGGLGNDIFSYDLVANRIDTITDFITADDQLFFKSSAFGSITLGELPSANFQTGTSNSATTTPGTPTFVFNTSTQTLWYDSDGAGGLGSNQMANLPGVTSLSYTDITIF
jgi:Ca2+-binding RTX toxin-like protein